MFDDQNERQIGLVGLAGRGGRVDHRVFGLGRPGIPSTDIRASQDRLLSAFKQDEKTVIEWLYKRASNIALRNHFKNYHKAGIGDTFEISLPVFEFFEIV